MNKVFINNAITKALQDYLKSNTNPSGVTYNSFLVVVIRALISLYGELDIINPYNDFNDELLIDNIAKFGYGKNDVNVFFSSLEMYYNIEKANETKLVKDKNDYFITVQKQLVDMFIKKKVNFHLTDDEVKEFYDLLYTPYTSNPLRISYNFLTAKDPLEVDNYYKKQMTDNVKTLLPEEKHFLNVRAYEILNYSMDDIKNLNSSEIDKINTKVYDYFKIRENAINKEYLLEKAIEEFERENDKVTSGNGYVDILLILSVICTVAMVIGIITFILI